MIYQLRYLKLVAYILLCLCVTVKAEQRNGIVLKVDPQFRGQTTVEVAADGTTTFKVDDAEIDGPEDPSDVVDPATETEVLKPIKPTVVTKPVVPTEVLKPIQPTDVIKPIGPTETTTAVDPTEVLKPVDGAPVIPSQVTDEDPAVALAVPDGDLVPASVPAVDGGEVDQIPYEGKQVITLNPTPTPTPYKFMTYQLKKTEGVSEEGTSTEVDNAAVYQFIPDGEISSGSEISFDGIMVAKELVDRMRNTNYKAHSDALTELLDSNNPGDFTNVLFGDGDGYMNLRGLLEKGRNASDANYGEKYKLGEKGLSLKTMEEEIFSTGYLLHDGKYLKISDIKAVGLRIDEKEGKVKLLKNTTLYLLEEILARDIAITEEDKVSTREAICYSNCNIGEGLGSALSSLVELAAIQSDHQSSLYCTLSEFAKFCPGNEKLQSRIDYYKKDLPADFKCESLSQRVPADETEVPPEEIVEEVIDADKVETEDTKDDSVAIVFKRKSVSIKDGYLRLEVSLDGEEAKIKELKDQGGKFYLECPEDASKFCKDMDEVVTDIKFTAIFDKLKKDSEFDLKVSYKISGDEDAKLIQEATFTVDLSCKDEDEDSENAQKDCVGAEDDEEDKDEDKDRRFTEEDFLKNFQDDYGQSAPSNPPPRFQPIMLPAPMGMSIMVGSP